MRDEEWLAVLRHMDQLEAHIIGSEPATPDLRALRCVNSRHRTLAHLRACQETWLEVALAFEQKPNSRIKLLHPWRLFEQRSYELLSWQDHLEVYVRDRRRWKALLERADRNLGGKMNGKEFSIENLTARLVAHEQYHLFEPR